MTRKNKPKPPGGSIPTYIRFTIDQLAAMDEAVRKGRYMNRSEAARDAVRSLFNIGQNEQAPGDQRAAEQPVA